MADADANDDENSVEICGYGRVTKAEVEKAMTQDGGELPALVARVKAALTRRPEQGLSQLSARLAIGSDAERVAGRLIMGDREGAAGIAAQSWDAAAYRLGLAGCSFGEHVEGSPSCRGLSIQGWIERDPVDARPWLSLASQALAKRDEAALHEALAEAAKRRELSSSDLLMQVATRVAPVVVTDRAELGSLFVDIVGQQSSMMDWSGTFALSKYCSAASLKDGQSVPLCRQLAVQMMDGADNFVEAGVAQLVADRAGVPAKEQRFDAATLAVAQQRFHEHFSRTIGHGLDCASHRRVADVFAERMAYGGELQMALNLLKRSGPSAAASTAVR